MTDRRAEVTQLEDGTYRLEGIISVADVPNINGIIYPADVLGTALQDFLAKDWRPVTFGCNGSRVLPRVEDVIGEVVAGTFEEGIARVVVQTLATSQADQGMVTRRQDAALVASGLGEVVGSQVTVYEITSIGIVPVADVLPFVSRNTSDQ